MNFGDGDYDIDQILGFIVSIESQFYPEIGLLFQERIEAWAADRRRERELDESEDAQENEATREGAEVEAAAT